MYLLIEQHQYDTNLYYYNNVDDAKNDCIDRYHANNWNFENHDRFLIYSLGLVENGSSPILRFMMDWIYEDTDDDDEGTIGWEPCPTYQGIAHQPLTITMTDNAGMIIWEDIPMPETLGQEPEIGF